MQLFIALAIHKSVLSFSLGMRLVQSRLPGFGVVLCAATFGLTATIGGFVGIAVTDVLAAKPAMAHFVEGAFQGLASGTFMYVL